MSNKVAYMLSRPRMFAYIVLNNASLSHYNYIEHYATDEGFRYFYERLTHGSHVEKYYLQGKFLYDLDKLFIPTSRLSSHFSCVWVF